MLDQAYCDAWLDSETPKDSLKDILGHDIDGQLQFNRVGREVNSTVINNLPNDHPALVGPIAERRTGFVSVTERTVTSIYARRDSTILEAAHGRWQHNDERERQDGKQLAIAKAIVETVERVTRCAATRPPVMSELYAKLGFYSNSKKPFPFH
ncbi:hypothetical protein NKI73_33000 [Mesorhizobium sp. M0496]